jgi:glycosyltransferase involved in cell wall biosynthesis
LNQVLSILNSISDSLTIIGGNTESLQINEPRNTTVVDIHVKMHDVVDITPRFYSKLLWAYKAILCQILDAIAIMRNARDIDVVLFYMSYPHEALPLITAKALGKRTCIVQTRSHRTGKGLLSRLLNVQDSLIYRAADAISPESDSLVSGLGLTKYRPKLTAEGYRYVDPRKYNVKKGIGQRSRVGFISRLEEQKGILGFMEAAQRLIETGHADIAFFVGGDGSQRKVVQAKTTGLKKAGARIE